MAAPGTEMSSPLLVVLDAPEQGKRLTIGAVDGVAGF